MVLQRLMMHGALTMDFGVYFGLEGKVQTVPRSELFAIIVLCLLAAPNISIRVGSDSAICVSGVASKQRSGENWDMWGRLWKLVGDKQIQLECFWVKSHGDEHPEFFSKYDLSVHDSFGNCCADRLAIAAASAAEIPLHIANPVLKKISHTQLIQKRLVAILQELVVAFPRQGTATWGP